MTDLHAWREHAACRGLDPNLFHGERGDSHAYRSAIKVCEGTQTREQHDGEWILVGTPPCPVKLDCLMWIIDTYSNEEDRYGIYGGTTPNQRVTLRRKIARVQPTVERDIEREHTPTPAVPLAPATSPEAWLDQYERDLLAKLESEQVA